MKVSFARLRRRMGATAQPMPPLRLRFLAEPFSVDRTLTPISMNFQNMSRLAGCLSPLEQRAEKRFNNPAPIARRAANPAIVSNQRAERPAIAKINAAKTNVVGNVRVLNPARTLLFSRDSVMVAYARLNQELSGAADDIVPRYHALNGLNPVQFPLPIPERPGSELLPLCSVF